MKNLFLIFVLISSFSSAYASEEWNDEKSIHDDQPWNSYLCRRGESMDAWKDFFDPDRDERSPPPDRVEGPQERKI